MSIQVAHVAIGLSRDIRELMRAEHRLAGALTDAVFDWADSQQAITGIVWSLWPDTFPGLIVLSPFKLSQGQGISLVEHIEACLKRNRLWAAPLHLHWSFRQGEVRLYITDDELVNVSSDSTTSTPNPTASIHLVAGDMNASSRED